MGAQSGRASHAFDIPSLDGIRALSVLIVLLSHVGYGNVVPGGLGVTVFFFLSGFLITTLMLNEHHATGRIAIAHFYVRRFCRLAPPLVITLMMAYSLTLFGVLQGGATKEGFLAQLLYFANYYDLFFEGAQNVPKGTGILWSLAVEEHFYIVYPLLMSWLLARLAPRSIGIVFIATCAAVLAWRYALTTPGGFNANRIYYATDTRLDSILFGCVLAVLANPMTGGSPKTVSHRTGWLMMSLGAILIVFTLLYRDAQFRESSRYTLQGIGLMPLFYYAITMVGSPVHRFLNWPPLRRLGVYSYVIYLVHHVVVNVLQEHFSVMQPGPVLLAATLALSIAYAAFIDTRIDPYFRKIRRAYHA